MDTDMDNSKWENIGKNRKRYKRSDGAVANVFHHPTKGLSLMVASAPGKPWLISYSVKPVGGRVWQRVMIQDEAKTRHEAFERLRAKWRAIEMMADAFNNYFPEERDRWMDAPRRQVD